MDNKVSIITVNYNGYKDTCELIDSLYKYETFPYELIIVDNGSKKNEASLLKKRQDANVIVIRSETNLGFSGGNNLAYPYATGKYLFYLNNDIVIEKPILEPLIKRLETKSIGLVSPKIKYESARDIIQFAGFTPLSFATLRNNIIGMFQKDNGQYDKAFITPYAHGAAMMAKRNVVETVGLMTEVYFLFYEELDWSIRFQRAGYQNWYEPSATVYHKEGMSIQKGTPLRLFYMTRARILFIRRNLNGVEKLLSILYIIIGVLARDTIINTIHKDWESTYAAWKGTWYGLKDKKT